MAEIKVFRDKFEAIQYKLIDIDGNEKLITQAAPYTVDTQDRIEKIIREDKITWGEKIWKQLVIIFGTDEETLSIEFWKKFQLTFVSQILEDFTKSSKKK
jgi:hypothetical protein